MIEDLPYIISSAQGVLPENLASFERFASFLGLLVIGWFFWKRDATRSDESVKDRDAKIEKLEREIVELRADNLALHNEIRTIIEQNK